MARRCAARRFARCVARSAICRECGVLRQPDRSRDAVFLRRSEECIAQGCAAAAGKGRPGWRCESACQGYSKGMRQRLGFAQALLGKPRCCSSMSRPTVSIRKASASFYQILREMKEQGVTVILTSHILSRSRNAWIVRHHEDGQDPGNRQSAILREQNDLLCMSGAPGGRCVEVLQRALAPLAIEIFRCMATAFPCDADVMTRWRCWRRNLPRWQGAGSSRQEPSLEDVFLGYSG